MSNGLLGPSTTDTITGGKTLELSEYDKVRTPHELREDGTLIRINVRTLTSELCCPICLDLLTSTMTTKECLHRFCSECITTALMRGNKECPTCRKKLVSKRSLRPDPNFDRLISNIWPDRKKYEEMQEEATRNYHQQNSVEALQKSIEAGMRAQEVNRRKRVQGSYDYEKRKRKPKAAPTDEPTGESSSTSAINGEVVSNGRGEGEEHDSSGTEDSDITSDDSSSLSSDSSLSDSHSADSAGEGGGVGAGAVSDGEETSKSLGDRSSLRSTSVDYCPPGSKRGRKPAGPKGASSSSRAKASGSSTQGQASTSGGCSSIKPPSALYDKMEKWLSDRNPSSSPYREAPMIAGGSSGGVGDGGRCTSSAGSGGQASTGIGGVEVSKRLEEMRKSGEEIDVELVPAKSLLARKELDSNREVGENLRQSRYIKVSPDATMAHLAEYLRQVSEASQEQESDSKSEAIDTVPKVEYFYILDHNNQLRKMFLHDTLFSAFIVSTLTSVHSDSALDSEGGGGAGGSDECSTARSPMHLMIYFDIAPPDVNSQQPLIAEVVSSDVLKRFASIVSVESSVVNVSTSGGRESKPSADFIPIYRRDKESSTTSSLTS